MTTHKAKATIRQLLWSEDGEIGCSVPTHAPFPGSDTWWKGRWQVMTLAERVQLAAEIDRDPECESCAAIARNAR